MRISFAFVSLAIMLIAGIVSAIPESQVDRSDPYLFEKIYNGSIVIDPPESHKRQYTVIARLCTGKNLQGCSSDYELSTTKTQIPIITAGISSDHLKDM